MKIQANELRIGNWYNSVKFNRPVMCELSDLSELYRRCDGGACDESIISEMFEPLILTEERLLKAGFEKDDTKYIYGIQLTEYVLEVSKNAFSGTLEKDPDWFISIPTGFGSQPVTIVRSYVHELQDLYRSLERKELKLQ